MKIKTYYFHTIPSKDVRAVQFPCADISGDFATLDDARLASKSYAQHYPKATAFVIEDDNNNEIERWQNVDGEWRRLDA